MYKIHIGLLAVTTIMLFSNTAMAQWSQSTACPGWNNPSNFSVGDANYFYYSGQGGNIGSSNKSSPNPLTSETGCLWNALYGRSDMYADSSIVTLVATPFDGYEFLMWNDGDTTNPRQVFVTSDTVFAAVFSMSDTTGINPVDGQHHLATIYPNPTDGDVTINVVEPSMVTVIDAAGRIAIPATHIDNSLIIHRSTLNKGIYFVAVVTHNAAALKKMIVRYF